MYGNLVYHATARNFGPIMCSASNTAIVQSSQIVNVGGLDPEIIVTPGIFVQKVVEINNPAHESELVSKNIKYL
jgi:3-oxoadipate CoA-transferase alpha subunit